MKEKQYTTTNAHGTKFYYKDPEMTILHREDGPAMDYEGDGEVWYLDGMVHRTDGPAYISNDGSSVWFQNDMIHRLDGPAGLQKNGNTEWYVNNVFLFEISSKTGNIVERMK